MPLFLTVIFLLGVNGFEAFWFWTIVYASKYASLVTLDEGVYAFIFYFMKIIKPNFLIILLSLLGLASVAWDKNIRKNYAFSFGFLVISFLAITPGLFFRPHYFILLVPALALFAGMGVSAVAAGLASHWQKTAAVLCVLGVSFGAAFYSQKSFFFSLSPNGVVRYVYGANPFLESLPIAEFIKMNTDKNDEVAVFGSEPQIYFYSKRRSATGFLYMYPLMEKHEFALPMRLRLIKEVEARHPKFIVVASAGSPLLANAGAGPMLAKWARDYIQSQYKLAALAHLISPSKTIYKWGVKPVEAYLRSTGTSPDKIYMLVYIRII